MIDIYTATKTRDRWLSDPLTKKRIDLDHSIESVRFFIRNEKSLQEELVSNVIGMGKLLDGFPLDELPNMRNKMCEMDNELAKSNNTLKECICELDRLEGERKNLEIKMDEMGYTRVCLHFGNNASWYYVLPDNVLPDVEKETGGIIKSNAPSPEPGTCCSDTHPKYDKKWYEFWR